MPKKKKRSNYSAIAALFAICLFVAVPLAAPFLTKKQNQEKQDATQKALEELQKQQAEAEAEKAPAEVDESFKQTGDIASMQIIDLLTGSGQEAEVGDTIRVKYKGALASDGTVFDSNSDGVEFQLVQGALIDGWIEGIPGMKVGGKRRLVIPSEKGYGAQGTQGIPADADLVFEVELVAIK